MRPPVDSRSSADAATTATLAIGEVSARAGVPVTTIRYYEERGLLAPVARVSGRRRFAESVVRRLWLIELCTTAGFSLDDTKVLLGDRDRGGQRGASRALAAEKLAEIDAQVARLEQARALIAAGLACTCPSLEECSCGAVSGAP